MPPAIIALAAVSTGLAALALTPWMQSTARSESTWLRSGAHVPLAGLGGVGAAMLARDVAELFAFVLLTLACALLVVIDLAAYRLPDVIIGPMYPVLFTALVLAAAVSGDWGRLGRAVAAAGLLLLGYFLLAFLAPSGLGLGDVKLSGLLGAFLGWLGWSQAFVGSLAAFVLSSIVAAVLLITTSATRRSAFPFGPLMVAGAALGAAYGPTLLPGLH